MTLPLVKNGGSGTDSIEFVDLECECYDELIKEILQWTCNLIGWTV